MKLWLDDVRPAPKGWEWAKTAREAIEMLGVAMSQAEPIVSISLDHDLGADPAEGLYARGLSEHCGCEVVEFLANRQPSVVNPIRVHSWNGYEADKMVNTLKNAGYAAFYEPYRIGTPFSN